MANKLAKKLRGYLGDRYKPEDEELIQLYCETRDLFDQYIAEIKRTGLVMEYTNKAGATNTVKNPLAIEATKTAQVLNTILKSLGLTASQRKAGEGDGDEGKGDSFDKF